MPPKVDESKCDGCGTCVEVCPADPTVFAEPNPKAKVVHPEACESCLSCVENCPNEAITFIEEE